MEELSTYVLLVTFVLFTMLFTVVSTMASIWAWSVTPFITTLAFTSFTMSVAASLPTWLEMLCVTTSSWVATSFFVVSSAVPVAVS